MKAFGPQFLAENVDKKAPQLPHAAVLFTDLLGFTSISEQMVPADLLRWLDGFFVQMREEIRAEEGMVDKFIGDSVLAVFGVPTRLENPCDAAFQAAHRMQGALTELNRAAPIGPGIELRMGVGIHYGPVIAGPLGGLAYHGARQHGEHRSPDRRTDENNPPADSFFAVGT